MLNTLVHQTQADVKMANLTQRDCRVCHGPIARRYVGKPPFIEFGANYLRRQIINEKYAPRHNYSFTKDLYPKVRYNHALKKIKYSRRLQKRKASLPKYKSVFIDHDNKLDPMQSELLIAARNTLKFYCKKYEAIEFQTVKLISKRNEAGQYRIYFQFIFDTLHLRELPDFLDVLANSNYFTLKNDPSIKYVANNHPLHKMNQHYYQIIQEGIIQPKEFNL
tara:strand:- start:1151 stop:1813 length:663 start_codon:yes stop_codon:yes gene_type:complete